MDRHAYAKDCPTAGAALSAGLAPGDLVLAACSGGADSLALAAALAFEGPRLGLRSGGVTVDTMVPPETIVPVCVPPGSTMR